MPYWGRVTTQMWAVLRSFLRRYFAGKPVVTLRNVGCFSGLTNQTILNQQTGVFHFFSFSQQEDLLRGREIRRLRYGTDIDFTDYKPPFQKHITLKAQALEAEDN